MNWIQSLTGGLMIGAAALMLYGLIGRIAGISGIFYGAVWREAGPERHWRFVFLLALIGGGWLAALADAGLPQADWSAGTAVITTVAGLLVGYGTRLANGCTSGHGVCGLGRRSPRSLAAVAVFMATGAAVATLLRPWLIWTEK